ncbi:hypothetical protein [Microbispora sp. NPDC046933]|uniref:hypothetical protein n=1 Tax=Microbispora sp. NPDC046933 TaxID=3155618 RepID=UPI0033F44BCE
MILILSDRQDTTVRRVIPKIERLGVPVTRWDSGEFPAGSRVTAALARGPRRPAAAPAGESTGRSAA